MPKCWSEPVTEHQGLLREKPACAMDDCAKPAARKGWCSMHHARWRRHGDPHALRPGPPHVPTTCSIGGCTRTSKAFELCDMHYKRLWKHGDPLKGAKGVRKVRVLCVVNGCRRSEHLDRHCRVHRRRLVEHGDPLWSPPPPAPRMPKCYRVVQLPNHPLAHESGTVLEHRLVLFASIGPGLHQCYWCGVAVAWATGAEAIRSLVVDHLDHDKLNNSPTNLVPSCNGCNAHRTRGENWTPWSPGTPPRTEPRLKARCRRGHEMTPENVYIRPDTGRRWCVECRRQRDRNVSNRSDPTIGAIADALGLHYPEGAS